MGLANSEKGRGLGLGTGAGDSEMLGTLRFVTSVYLWCVHFSVQSYLSCVLWCGGATKNVVFVFLVF